MLPLYIYSYVLIDMDSWFLTNVSNSTPLGASATPNKPPQLCEELPPILMYKMYRKTVAFQSEDSEIHI